MKTKTQTKKTEKAKSKLEELTLWNGGFLERYVNDNDPTQERVTARFMRRECVAYIERYIPYISESTFGSTLKEKIEKLAPKGAEAYLLVERSLRIERSKQYNGWGYDKKSLFYNFAEYVDYFDRVEPIPTDGEERK